MLLLWGILTLLAWQVLAANLPVTSTLTLTRPLFSLTSSTSFSLVSSTSFSLVSSTSFSPVSSTSPSPTSSTSFSTSPSTSSSTSTSTSTISTSSPSSSSSAPSTNPLAAVIAALPQCAVICLAKAVVNSTCSPTDQQCICTDAPLNAQVNVCVQSTCTIKESLTTLNVTSTACGHPIRDRRLLYNVISNVFGVSSGVAVVLRLLSRYLADSRLWLDDYTILFVMAIGIPSSVINVHGLTSNGLGKDIWTLTFKNISDVIHLSLVKISILLFYLRLFPGTTIRRVIYATITFNVLVGLTFDLIALLQCRPIDFYWKRWDGEHKGKCLNINALAWANAAINIASDLWLLGLPMTQLVRLNLHWKKKVGVAMMFGVGTFVTAVSILRLQSLVLFANSQNPTWDNVPVGYWSTMEINVGIICSCMPSIRLLLIRAFPKVMSTTQENSKYSYDQSGSIDKRNITRVRDKGGYVYNKSVDIGRSRDPTDEIGSSNLELVHIGKRAEDI